MTPTHLRDVISHHKAHVKLNVHSSNEKIDYKTEGERKIQLTIKINSLSSKDSDKIRITHTKSDNIDILMGSETNNIIKEVFKSIIQKYQEGLEQSKRGSEFIFESVNLLYYRLQRISLKRGGSYLDFPKWLKKTATINLKNNDNNCFQYALSVALN